MSVLDGMSLNRIAQVCIIFHRDIDKNAMQCNTHIFLKSNLIAGGMF